MSTTYDFEAVNAAGVTVATFNHLDVARRWVRENAALHDGLRVECVTRTVRRQVVYRPRGSLRLVEQVA
jgi:hypothetical protein